MVNTTNRKISTISTSYPPRVSPPPLPPTLTRRPYPRRFSQLWEYPLLSNCAEKSAFSGLSLMGMMLIFNKIWQPWTVQWILEWMGFCQKLTSHCACRHGESRASAVRIFLRTWPSWVNLPRSECKYRDAQDLFLHNSLSWRGTRARKVFNEQQSAVRLHLNGQAKNNLTRLNGRILGDRLT